jgi:hypothetical protein
MTTPVLLVTHDPSAYLGPDDVGQSDHPEITPLAEELLCYAKSHLLAALLRAC